MTKRLSTMLAAFAAIAFAATAATAQTTEELAASAEQACMESYDRDAAYRPPFSREEHDAACRCVTEALAPAELNVGQYRFVYEIWGPDAAAGEAALAALSQEEGEAVLEALFGAIEVCRPDR